jgi:hypothetical protein
MPALPDAATRNEAGVRKPAGEEPHDWPGRRVNEPRRSENSRIATLLPWRPAEADLTALPVERCGRGTHLRPRANDRRNHQDIQWVSVKPAVAQTDTSDVSAGTSRRSLGPSTVMRHGVVPNGSPSI